MSQPSRPRVIHGVVQWYDAGLRLAPCSASVDGGSISDTAAAAPIDSSAGSAAPGRKRSGTRKRSRQAEYMRRRRATGLCRYCTEPCAPGSKSRCIKHLEAHRELMALYRSAS